MSNFICSSTDSCKAMTKKEAIIYLENKFNIQKKSVILYCCASRERLFHFNATESVKTYWLLCGKKNFYIKF